MSLFIVDDQKCKRDGACAAECPLGIIEFKNDNSAPVPTPNANELCINCGHCVAICPHGALSHRNMSPEECPPVQKTWTQNPEQIEHFLRSRRSIRVYKDLPAERTVLNKLIDIARFAPSGHNTQPVNWLVIYDSAKVKQLAGLVIDWMRHMLKAEPRMAKAMHMDLIIDFWKDGFDAVCRSAPHLIITHAPKEDYAAPVACTIALTYLELAAPSFGLGTCWAGFFNSAVLFWPPLYNALELPGQHMSLGAMMIGYPKYEYHRLPPRNEARIMWR